MELLGIAAMIYVLTPIVIALVVAGFVIVSISDKGRP